MLKVDLPEPDSEAAQHSAKLLALIRNAVMANGGWLDFARYMELALYTPGLGYYSSGLQKFGEQGDFITAPEVSGLFGKTLAQSLSQVLRTLPQGCVLEFGAGSGKLAADMLGQLHQSGCMPHKYYIMELSAGLRARQQHTLQSRVPHLVQYVQWLDTLPLRPINAVVVANEMLDAMPVRRFVMENNKINEIGVACAAQGLLLQTQTANEALQHAVDHIEQETGHVFTNGYTSEINLNIAPWLQSISAVLDQGAIYLIDYGYPRAEYYAPERHMGTLMCYYRQRAHDDALRYPGLQDITAFVDFTAVAEAAVQAGFDIDGFTSQANFLLDSGLMQMLEDATDERRRFVQAQQVKTLTLASEMGERFKVIGLNKNIDMRLPGFGLQDLRYRL
jgi:SAM-dependent MidA family methyltransferase